MKIRENVPIKELTTMRLGGPARYVIEIQTEDDVREAYRFAKQKHLPVFILGSGANTIGHDEGFPGVIILDQLKGITFQEEGEETLLTTAGGEIWDDVVAAACERGLTGIEALTAIPGTAGAAPVQNIGAYGQEAATTIAKVRAYDSETGDIVEFLPAEMHFRYRKSIFNTEQAGRYFILSVTFRLKKGEMPQPYYASLQRYIDEHGETDFSPAGIRHMVGAIRSAKLPDPAVEASAGSFFKNVYLDDKEAEKARAKGVKMWSGDGINKVNSGWLIEAVGLKGAELNGMRISDKAALILINDHAESYADLATARATIRDKVKAEFGYELEQEPVEIPPVLKPSSESVEMPLASKLSSESKGNNS